MPGRPPLTEVAHEAWRVHLSPGEAALDATAGNGCDTEFLARELGPQGKVYAVDIQAPAIAATRRRLEQRNLLKRVDLIPGDHSNLRELLGDGLDGKLCLACFNLGYLPTGDHRVTTRPDTTLKALEQALYLIKPAGALSVMVYRGHEGAVEEANAVEEYFKSLPPAWQCRKPIVTGSSERPGPVLWLASRER
jgi:SAM-dependent methyltransferase